jgi:hypothetical protein
LHRLLRSTALRLAFWTYVCKTCWQTPVLITFDFRTIIPGNF